jgi:2-dehydropantoate 2-reductase
VILLYIWGFGESVYNRIMNIAIFGTGGVGGYFGGRLAQGGENVTFIARGEHLRAIQAGGLRVESIAGDFLISPARATDDPGQVGPVDVVLLATKAWQVPGAAEAMRPMIGTGTCVVPLGNGVEAPDQLAAVLGGKHVLGGLCYLSAFLAGPGHIRHVGIEPVVMLGELDRQVSLRAERLRGAFEQAGVKVSIPDDIQVAMWDKFLFIAAISGIGAVTRVPVGEFRDLPETRSLLVAALQEIVAIARARGIRLPADALDKRLAFIDGMAQGVVASMSRDIVEGRPSELEAQNGAVVRMGRSSGVPTPVHELIYSSLLPQERRARGESHA